MITNCRSCGSHKLKNILSLGDQYLSDFVDNKKDKPIKAPLNLMICRQCALVQLNNTVEAQLLYNDHYGYFSGINNTMKAHLKGIVEAAFERVSLYEGDVVIDIGSNDATLLKNYPDKLLRVGFDPVKKFRKYYEKSNLIHVAHFFEANIYKKTLE